MSHTIAPSLPRRQAQAGHLLERPSPARITAFAGVIALHAAAFVLLLMPMAPPQALLEEDVAMPIFVHSEARRTGRLRRTPPPIDGIRTAADHAPRAGRRSQQPPVVDPVGVDVAPPYDPTPDTAIAIETIPPVTGPIRTDSLEYASAPPPAYPRDAMMRRIEGTVVLEVLVGVDGVPLDVRVQTSSGNRSLDEAARKHMLKHWKFKPATQDGHAVQAVGPGAGEVRAALRRRMRSGAVVVGRSIAFARYNCSASTSRTSMCGSVSGPSDQFVGPRDHFGRMAFGPADQEREIAPRAAPVFQALRELLRTSMRCPRPSSATTSAPSAARPARARLRRTSRARHRGPCRARRARFRPGPAAASATGASGIRRIPRRPRPVRVRRRRSAAPSSQ